MLGYRLFAALDLAERHLGRLARLFAAAGGVALTSLMAVTVVAVFWRYALNNPIFGIEDVSTMALTVVVAASIAYCAKQGGHVGVNVIKMVAGRSATRITDIVARALGIAITAISAYALFLKGGCGLPCGAITNNLSIVHTPFYYFLGAAMAFYSALLLVQTGIGLANWRADDPNEPRD
ncbi:MAG: TRAP transporter small permease [Albidovulum sp.]|nr:TRAP transporter small permease [Albidovulum sp.]